MQQEPVIVGALSCINTDFQQKKEKLDSYTLALVAYANSLYQPQSRTTIEIIGILDSKAQRNGMVLIIRHFWQKYLIL